MNEALIPVLVDSREFQSLRNKSSSYLPSDGLFESFDSSASSRDGYYTPPSSGSSEANDMEGMLSYREPLRPDASNGLVEVGFLYPTISMSAFGNNMGLEPYDADHFYKTSRHKYILDHTLMSYDYPQAGSLSVNLNFRETFNGMPGMVFDDAPGVMFKDSSSPLQLASKVGNFVVPSQTFISEPYHPMTPTEMSGVALGSPLVGYSQYPRSIQYFMSPRETQSDTSHSSTSIFSDEPHKGITGTALNSTFSSSYQTAIKRSQSIQPAESSPVLHRIQTSSGSHTSKAPKVEHNISRQFKGGHRCFFKGCSIAEKGFVRLEHLKRHQRMHTDHEVHPCPFCARPFRLDRRDNYWTHVELHTKKKKGSRTKYYPEARAYVDANKKVRSADRKLEVPG